MISNNFIWDKSNYLDNLSVESNIFKSPGYSNNSVIVFNNSNVLNNIFFRNIPLNVSSNTSFRNNMGIALNSVSGSNFGSLNLYETSDIEDNFVNYVDGASGITYVSDLHLVHNSPLLTVANDGGQIGIYGVYVPDIGWPL